jgi:septal ring factor EnvC (AmiA/AmiB activator)
MTKNYFILGLCLALAICIAFLLWPEKQHDTHASQHADIVADHDTLKAHDAISARVIDSLNKTITEKDSANKALKEGQQVARRQLDLKTAQLKNTAAEIRDYNKDTGYFGHLLDSLQQQAESFQFLVVQYEQYADSINNVNDSMKINYDAKDKEKDRAKAELQAAYDKLYRDYQGLFDISRALMKDLKRQKLKTKIAAVLGAAGAVILLLR